MPSPLTSPSKVTQRAHSITQKIQSQEYRGYPALNNCTGGPGLIPAAVAALLEDAFAESGCQGQNYSMNRKCSFLIHVVGYSTESIAIEFLARRHTPLA